MYGCASILCDSENATKSARESEENFLKYCIGLIVTYKPRVCKFHFCPACGMCRNPVAEAGILFRYNNGNMVGRNDSTIVQVQTTEPWSKGNKVAKVLVRSGNLLIMKNIS